ncbi:MAG: signal peptidase II [Chloroflexi bacterium]|nr:signal peptidase II [Chloroflexota bacterium]
MQETDLTSNPPQATENPVKKKRGWSYYWIYGVSAGVYLLDQLVKFWAEQSLGPANSGRTIELLGGQFRFIYIKNSGASFGMLKEVPWLFAILAMVASLGIIIWYQMQGTEDNWQRLGVGLILGGIIGNLSDRLFKGGSVTDMLNFPNIELFRVFNAADAAITCGIVAILIQLLISSLPPQKTTNSKETGN